MIMPVTLSRPTNATVAASTTSMSRRPPPRGNHASPGSFSLKERNSIMTARQAITTPSQNGRNAEPGPPEPHHWYCFSAPAENATAKASSSAAVTRSAPRTCLLRGGLETLDGVLVLGVQAVEVLQRLVAGPVGGREEVALDVVLLPLLGGDDFLQRVLPPLHGFRRHVRRADHAAHLLPVELVTLLGKGRHVGGVLEALLRRDRQVLRLAGLDLRHDLVRVLDRGVDVPAHQRGGHLAAGVERHVLHLDVGRLLEEIRENVVLGERGGAADGEAAGLGARRVDEVFDGLERRLDRKSTRLNSSHSQISYAV